MAWADPATARQRPGKVAILRAAVSVMGEDGYEGASMREMAARAGVSVAAIYYHFPSKHDMLREFLDDAWRIALDRLERRLRAAPDDPTARLDEIVATLVASQNHDEFAQLAANVALREHTRLNPPERAAIEEQQQRLVEIVEREITAGAEAGEFTTSDAAEATRAILAVVSSFAAMRPPTHRPLPEVIEIAQRFSRSIACA
jgi:AcrR family transcriptional regulator